jgi:hypothetical protein
MELGMNKEYYIATATEKVFLPPAGDLYINGFAAEAMFYRGSLDKLGIEPEVFKSVNTKTRPTNTRAKKCRPNSAKSSTRFWMNTSRE